MQHGKTVEPVEGAAVVLELDEVWHYRKRKLWIWKGLRRDTGEYIV